MSIRPSVASGFIPEHEFGDACQELCGLALKSGQSESHFEHRQELLSNGSFRVHVPLLCYLNSLLDQIRFLIISRGLCFNGLPEKGSADPTFTEEIDASLDSDGASDEDDAAIHHTPASSISSSVEYHVIHSTSYQVPVLYFFIHDTPHIKSLSIDRVYERLVPHHLRDAAKEVGVMGGIGMTNHPMTDMPCFWVHPCNTAEAMGSYLKGIDREVSPVEYLMIWIGIVGAAVELSLPKAIMLAKTP